MWNEHDQKVSAKQAISAAHLRQHSQESWEELFSVFLQVLVERMPIICETEIVATGIRFSEWIDEEFFCLICILSSSRGLEFTIINTTSVVFNLFH